MTIKVSASDWENPVFRNSVLMLAEQFGNDIEIETVRKPLPPYNAQVWLNDDIVASNDFKTKKEAKKWIASELAKRPNAEADLRKYNKRGDDFDGFVYRLVDGVIAEVEAY